MIFDGPYLTSGSWKWINEEYHTRKEHLYEVPWFSMIPLMKSICDKYILKVKYIVVNTYTIYFPTTR